MKRYLNYHDLDAYKKANEISQIVWEIIIKWDYFSRTTIGIQFMRAVDSISANIAEGFGRYFRKDKIRFFYIARASALESLNWAEKAYQRKLFTSETYTVLASVLNELPKHLNALIGITSRNLTR